MTTPQLADPGQPLHVGGVAVSPAQSTNARKAFVDVPSNTEAQRLVARQRIALAELPGLPKTLNATSAVLTYTLTGLSDEDICAATMLTHDQIKRVRNSDAYGALQDHIVSTIKAHFEEDVRGKLAMHASAAADRVVELAKGSFDERVKLKANQDILDRAGHRPADVVEHRHKFEDALVIEHVTRDNQSPVTIDMEPS